MPDTQEYVDELLLAFCEHCHLTARERVILKEVLQGKDNQNIASSPQLALGTVQAHVHNILKKTSTTTDRVPNVGVRGRFPVRRKQEAVIA